MKRTGDPFADMIAAEIQSHPRHGGGGDGPYNSEREAHADAMKAGSTEPGAAALGEHQKAALLKAACAAAKVETGHYDDRVIRWLAGWEDATVMVVAGLIERAYQAGRAERPVWVDSGSGPGHEHGPEFR